MIRTIDVKYWFGDIVYLVTDPDQHMRMVTAIKITPDDTLLYEANLGISSSYFYDFEISDTKNVKQL